MEKSAIRPILRGLTFEATLWLKYVPRALLSEEFRKQVNLRRRYFPRLTGKYRVVRHRNWGTELSITLTGFFSIPIDQLVFVQNAEIVANLTSEEATEAFYRSARAEQGWSEAETIKRRDRTRELIASDPSTFFSEVSITQDGRFRITDGHHRATIALNKGVKNYTILPTVKVHRG